MKEKLSLQDYVALLGVALIFAALVLGLVFLLENSKVVHAQTQLPGETWTCSLDNIGATLTLCQAAPEPGMRLYITDIIAQSTTGTAGLYLLRYGTGTNCGTGTVSLFPGAAAVPRFVYPTNALFHGTINLKTALPVPAGKDLCVIGTATNTVTMQIIGYRAP